MGLVLSCAVTRTDDELDELLGKCIFNTQSVHCGHYSVSPSDTASIATF